MRTVLFGSSIRVVASGLIFTSNLSAARLFDARAAVASQESTRTSEHFPWPETKQFPGGHGSAHVQF